MDLLLGFLIASTSIKTTKLFGSTGSATSRGRLYWRRMSLIFYLEASFSTFRIGRGIWRWATGLCKSGPRHHHPSPRLRVHPWHIAPCAKHNCFQWLVLPHVCDSIISRGHPFTSTRPAPLAVCHSCGHLPSPCI